MSPPMAVDAFAVRLVTLEGFKTTAGKVGKGERDYHLMVGHIGRGGDVPLPLAVCKSLLLIEGLGPVHVVHCIKNSCQP